MVQSAYQLDDLLASAGVTIVDLSDVYVSGERVDRVARMLDQLLEYFQLQEDSEELKRLIVVEEAHLWTSKDLPKDASRFLDSAAKLLRKKGVEGRPGRTRRRKRSRTQGRILLCNGYRT